MEQDYLKTFNSALAQVISFLPAVFAALALLLLGILATVLIKKLVVRIGLLIRLDRLVGQLFAKADVRHTFLNILGNIIGLIIFLVFLDNALIVINLTALEKLVQRLVYFIPSLIISGIIFGIGLLVANRVAHSTDQLLSGEGLRHGYAISRFIRAGILVFVSALVLLQLDISREIVLYGFLIAMGSVGLAFVFAVGGGSREAVKKLWDFFLERHEK
jgi:hypothetical protein